MSNQTVGYVALVRVPVTRNDASLHPDAEWQAASAVHPTREPIAARVADLYNRQKPTERAEYAVGVVQLEHR